MRIVTLALVLLAMVAIWLAWREDWEGDEMNPIESEIRYAIRLAEYVHRARAMQAKGWIVEVTPKGARGKFGPAFARP